MRRRSWTAATQSSRVAGSDQALSTAGGKNSASAHTGGAPPSRTCQLPFPVLVKNPIEAPSWKLTKTLADAVLDGAKSA